MRHLPVVSNFIKSFFLNQIGIKYSLRKQDAFIVKVDKFIESIFSVFNVNGSLLGLIFVFDLFTEILLFFFWFEIFI